MNEEQKGRLRPPPEERFKPPQHLIDLEQAVRELAAEPAGPHGHRQKTLYRHGNTTLALFIFDAGSRMNEHRADGVVTIQAIHGHIIIKAEGQEHELTPGRLLVLSPGVKHDVSVREPSQMLLIVNREPR